MRLCDGRVAWQCQSRVKLLSGFLHIGRAQCGGGQTLRVYGRRQAGNGLGGEHRVVRWVLRMSISIRQNRQPVGRPKKGSFIRVKLFGKPLAHCKNC